MAGMADSKFFLVMFRGGTTPSPDNSESQLLLEIKVSVS